MPSTSGSGAAGCIGCTGGVYAVGYRRLAHPGRLWAAVLACGGPEAAALSHRSAAAVHELLAAPAGRVDVTTRLTSKPTRTIAVHRSATLDPLTDVVRDADGLPVTTVARTLFDLALVLSPHALERACHRAEVLRVLDCGALGSLLARVAGHRGAGRVRCALATLTVAHPDITRSELEERFLSLVARARLPRPRVNARAAGYEVDFLWPAERLIAETDGAAGARRLGRRP